MRRADWVDGDGRRYAVLVPDDAPPGDEHLGMPIGPPPLDDLVLTGKMTHAQMIRLHNDLWAREVFTEEDARRRPHDIVLAMQAAFRIDAMDVQALYAAPSIAEAVPPEPPPV